MTFSLNTRIIRDVVVVDLSGRVTVGESVRQLSEAVHSHAEQGFSRFVMNLEAVTYIDSCGLGELVATYTSICKRDGVVSLLKPSTRTDELLRMTKLYTVFAIFDDESEAIAALTARSGRRGA